MSKKMIRARLKLVPLLLLAVLLLAALPAAAQEGGPFQLAESSPADGATGVAVSTEITLIFTKNVVNMKVKENNAQCFTLVDPDGGSVPVDVVMPDDQMEPEKKREVYLKPKEALQPSTTYTVVIASGLQSKSGETLGEEVTVSFTTAAAPAASPELPRTGGHGYLIYLGLILAGGALWLNRYFKTRSCPEQ